MADPVEYVFRRTANPWIDLGIASIWLYLSHIYKSNETETEQGREIRTHGSVITLDGEKLKISGEEGSVLEILRDANEHLKAQLLRDTEKGTKAWTGLASFLYRQHKPPAPLLPFEKITTSTKWSNDVCDYCGYEGKTRPAGTSEYPLIVTSDKMSTFYSSLKGKIRICPSCYFASHFAPLKVLYSIGRNFTTLNMLVMEAQDLVALARSLIPFGDLFVRGQPAGNFEPALAYTQHPMETFLSFLITAYKEKGKRAEILEAAAASRFHILTAEHEKGSRTVLITRHEVIPNPASLFQVIEATLWTDRTAARKEHFSLQDSLNQLFFAAQQDTAPREEAARRIINRRQVSDVVENYLYKAILTEQGSVSAFGALSIRIFLDHYEKKVIGMDWRILESCRTLGDILGNLSARRGDKDPIYMLRSSRNLDDLLDGFQRVMIRHADELEPKPGRRNIDEILSGINESNWKTYRSLIGIYAVLRYIETALGPGEKKAGG